MKHRAKHSALLLVVLTAAAMLAAPARAQNLGGPLSDVVISGYGNVTWQAADDADFTNDFTAGFSPVLLYSLGSDFMFESELEFGVSGEVTTTSLEYAQIDYLGFNNVVVTAGKFLVPFGLFGERYHPTWINKLPTAPGLYGHAHGGVAEGGAVLPVLSDVGLMVKYRKPLDSGWGVNLAAWATQGPRAVAAEGDDHTEEEEAHKLGGIAGDGHGESVLATEIPAVGFGVSFPDNNSNKMLGARLGLVKGPKFEIYAGGFHARYDDNEDLDVLGSHLSMDFRSNDYELRFEGVMLWQDVEHEAAIEVLRRKGYYAQASRRIRAWEPVLQWSHVLESDIDGSVASEEQREISVGLTYWLEASIPLKLSYHADLEGDNHVFVQWAYGF